MCATGLAVLAKRVARTGSPGGARNAEVGFSCMSDQSVWLRNVDARRWSMVLTGLGSFRLPAAASVRGRPGVAGDVVSGDE